MSSAVVVVSRNATLSLALMHHGYDVTEVRPDAYGDWVGRGRAADAIVLELSDAVAAESAVLRLRAEGIGSPVLLVSNNTPGWDTTAAHVGGAARVLPLPISLPVLAAALDELIEAGPIDVPPPPTNEDEMLTAVAASVGLAISDDGLLVTDESSPLPRARVDLDERPPPPAEPVAEPESVVPEPAAVEAPAGPVVPVVPVGEFADSVLAWAKQRSSVAETAEVVVAEFADRVGADAGALLLPDGGAWRVAGGVGLRPLEHRARLDAGHWLVDNVATKGEGLLVDDTDAAREGLHDAPLASWARLLAVPVPDVHGVFVAARAGEVFTEEDLATALEVSREATPLLVDALALRAVARALAPFTDPED